MNIDPSQIIKMISDRKEVLKKILEIIDRNHKQAEGCAKLRESLVRKDSPNFSNENLANCASVALGVSGKNSEDIRDIAQIMVVYLSGNNFQVDAATMASKLGSGEDALKAMFKAKFGS